MRIGLISDTHDLLRAEASAALAGVDWILHAGDICTPGVLQRLESIAPVTAVRGNNDRGQWAQHLPASTVVRLAEVSILIVHDIATLPHAAAHGIDVVVCGHSHRPSIETRATTLYVNPGSAGPCRFRLPISLAYLELRHRRAHAQLHELSVNPL